MIFVIENCILNWVQYRQSFNIYFKEHIHSATKLRKKWSCEIEISKMDAKGQETRQIHGGFKKKP